MIGIVIHHLAQVGHVNGLQWVYVLCLIYRFQHLCGVLYSVIRSIFVGFPRFSCIIKEKRLILHRVFQTTVSGFSFPPPLMAATIKGFFTSIKKKELCNNGGLCCYHLLYYYTTKVLLFFDICKHFGNFFMRKIGICVYIDIYQLLHCFTL